MRRNWICIVGCFALVAGQSFVQAQGDAVPAAAAPELRRMPEVAESAALGFRKVIASGGFADAERTMVRVVSGGRVVQAQRVGIGGVAQISDVAAGPYSVFANGNEGVAAYGIHLGDDTVSNQVGLVPVRDASLVLNLVRTHLQGGSGGAPAAGANTTYFPENGDFEIDADGSVKGQAILPAAAGSDGTPLADHFVAFVQGGQVVAQTHTDVNGNFSVTGVDSGIYSIAFAGPEGFAAYSTGVIQPAANVQARVKRLQFVSLLAGGQVGIVVPANPRDLGLFHQTLRNAANEDPDQRSLAACCGGGGYGGGGSGGGGAGGGGGLLGALAGAGIGAGIGAALANQDNNNNAPATPAMP